MISPLTALDVTARAKAGAHKGKRASAPYGLVVHTTGSGVPTDAKDQKRPAMEIALDIYCRGPNAAHYVIDHAGVIACVAPEDVKTQHTGRFGPPPEKKDRRAQYMSGEWRTLCSKAAVAAWDRQWGSKYKHPFQLFPGPSPNDVYCGVELIPCIKGLGVPTVSPAAPASVFTEAQYVKLIALAEDMAIRHGWPLDWASGPRLVGHEDVGLIDRHNLGGAWDPGFLRVRPTFDFPRVRAALAPRSTGTAA